VFVIGGERTDRSISQEHFSPFSPLPIWEEWLHLGMSTCSFGTIDAFEARTWSKLQALPF
jgi:hypothetical protein